MSRRKKKKKLTEEEKLAKVEEKLKEKCLEEFYDEDITEILEEKEIGFETDTRFYKLSTRENP